MIDIKLIREQPELVEENMRKKNQEGKLHLVREARDKDAQWREIKQQIDKLRHERNTISKEINKTKKDMKEKPELKDRFQELVTQAKEIPQQIRDLEGKADEIHKEVKDLQYHIPNIMHKDVPIGKDDSENVEVKRWGEPKQFDFEVRPHQQIATELDGADFESAAETSGAGFYYLQGDVARLNQALIQYAISHMSSKGYLYVETPLLLNGNVMKNVTDIHDRENMIYKIEDEDLYLIGTSEHSLIGRYLDSFIEEKDLPIKQTSYSMCFRKEKGSHGLDERGLFRTHQFNKVEMVVICRPEESMNVYEEMKTITIDIFRNLELPVRDLAICSGDLGDLKHIQSDIEVWSPRREEYVEVGSCSNLTDSQSQLLGIRVKTPKGTFYPHTLNNTAIATSRALVAILENFQNEDGSVTIPQVLRPYMGGQERIEKKK
ncbi:MAG: serine--tRNA ligase [Candidatus Woesearchaeota archaeon]